MSAYVSIHVHTHTHTTVEKKHGTGEMTRQFRVLDALAEDPGLISRTYMVAYNHLTCPVQRSDTLLISAGRRYTHAANTCRQNTYIQNNINQYKRKNEDLGHM